MTFDEYIKRRIEILDQPFKGNDIETISIPGNVVAITQLPREHLRYLVTDAREKFEQSYFHLYTARDEARAYLLHWLDEEFRAEWPDVNFLEVLRND